MKVIKHVEGITYNRDDKSSANYFKNEFLKRRALVARKTYNKGSIEIEQIYINEYKEQCALANGGDIIAQDLISYWFKHGNPYLPENIEMSMKWLFLAGAGGNKHSLNKLNLFFYYAFDTICFSDYYDDLFDILDLDENDFRAKLGEVICKHLIEEMELNVEELTKQPLQEIKFNQLSMQRLTTYLNKVTPKVDDYFRSYVKNHKNESH